MPPFDAVLLISFGGPGGPADVRPFLENVTRGRRVPPERLDEVAHHYAIFGGVSPLTEFTLRQAAGIESRLRASGLPLPVFVGMRNWHPFLPDTLARMSEAGVRRAIGFIGAPHRSYSSCEQYRENVSAARRQLAGRGLRNVEIVYVGDWHEHPGFIDANAEAVRRARLTLPTALQADATLVFTAHSIPVGMNAAETYQRQLRRTAQLVAERTGTRDWVLAYQSRSGRPEDPWLGPDIVDHLRAEARTGRRAVVVSPIGFICDHIEVLYDLDHEAAAAARALGLAMARASTVNDAPGFLEAAADAIRTTWTRYASGRPLPVERAPGERGSV